MNSMPQNNEEDKLCSNYISINEIIAYVTGEYSGIILSRHWGERGLFYNPEGKLPKGVYILTFKEKDGPNDKASNVNRSGVYRLNLGISKQSFSELFGEIPKRPSAGKIVDTGHDFEILDQIMPHPVYGWSSWVCVLNPGKETFDKLKILIHEAVESAKCKYAKRCKNDD